MTILRNILRPDEFTGRHMAAVIGAFFGTVIAVNVTLAVFASKSWTGLVVENSYVASQHFNDETAVRQEGAALGWRLAAGYSGQLFNLRFTDRKGAALSGLRVAARIGRTTHEDEDRDVVLRQGGSGTYQASVLLAPGLWSVEVSAVDRNGAVWTRDLRFIVAE